MRHAGYSKAIHAAALMSLQAEIGQSLAASLFAAAKGISTALPTCA